MVPTVVDHGATLGIHNPRFFASSAWGVPRSIVPTTMPGVSAFGRAIFESVRRVDPDRWSKDPTLFPKNHPDLVWFRCLRQQTFLQTKHVSGESDTESVNGASEGEMVVVDDPETVPPGPFVVGPVVGGRLNDGLASCRRCSDVAHL